MHCLRTSSPSRCTGSFAVAHQGTFRSLETRLKEHWKACREGTTGSSVVAEHMHRHQRPIKWEETAIVDQAREQLLRESIHIHQSPRNCSTIPREQTFQHVGLQH